MSRSLLAAVLELDWNAPARYIELNAGQPTNVAVSVPNLLAFAVLALAVAVAIWAPIPGRMVD